MDEEAAEKLRKERVRRLVAIDSPIIVVAHPEEGNESTLHLYVHDPRGNPLFVDAVPGGYGLHLAAAVRRWLGDDTAKIMLRLWPDRPEGYSQ